MRRAASVVFRHGCFQFYNPPCRGCRRTGYQCRRARFRQTTQTQPRRRELRCAPASLSASCCRSDATTFPAVWEQNVGNMLSINGHILPPTHASDDNRAVEHVKYTAAGNGQCPRGVVCQQLAGAMVFGCIAHITVNWRSTVRGPTLGPTFIYQTPQQHTRQRPGPSSACWKRRQTAGKR